MKIFIILFFFSPLVAYSKWVFSADEKVNLPLQIEKACAMQIKKSNTKEICKCISKNHMIQATQAYEKSKALLQIKWVIDFYNGKIDQTQYSKDPYFIGGTSGVLTQFDDECQFDPNYLVTFPK